MTSEGPRGIVEVRTGSRLRCPACGLEVVVTKAGERPALACHVPLEVPPAMHPA